jgi:UDP-glucose 4-epimerase
MRVMVTGGGGFLGGAVVRALAARGDSVFSYDARFDPAAEETGGPGAGRIARVEGDIADAAGTLAVFRDCLPDAVVHAAAIVGVLPSMGDPARVVRVNVEGSVNVFEAMHATGVKRCIHVSSEEVYGPFRADTIDESHPLQPEMPYGACKAAVEGLARSFCALHGLEVIHLRTCWVYGPGLPRLRVPRNLVEAALAGRPLHLPYGAHSAIDHTYVDDFVSGVLAALDHPRHRHDVYHIASGEASTVARIAAIVRELVPGADVSAGPAPIRHSDRIELVRKGALDVSRARRELGWSPRYDIRAGLAEYLRRLGETTAREAR